MKITESFIRFASAASTTDFQREERQRRMSSFDTLVIPNRTRLPSSGGSQVEPIDLQIAANLLKAQARALPVTRLSHPALGPPQTRHDTGEITATHGEELSFRHPTPDSFNMVQAEDKASVYNNNISDHPHDTGTGNYRHCSTLKPHRTSKSGSGSWSHHGSRSSHDSAMDFPNDLPHGTSFGWQTDYSTASPHPLRAQPGYSANEYNVLAMTHGINPITVIDDYVNLDVLESVPAEVEQNTIRNRIKDAAGHFLRRDKKLRRAPSNQSIRSIMSSKNTNLFESASLEQICKLGGLAPVRLPNAFSPTEELSIPTSLAILANSVISNGPLIPEVFRVEGSNAMVTKLVDHFATQYNKSANAQSPNRTESIVFLNKMPANFGYDLHDITAAFKRIVRGLPGGFLGSLELYKALRDIQQKVYKNPQEPETQRHTASIPMKEPETQRHTASIPMIARALSSLASNDRFSIICAVLGLFAWIGHATKTTTGPPGQLMSYAAFATILLPMLINDDLRDVHDSEEHGGEITAEEKAAAGKKYIRDARNIANMLLPNWTAIVIQLRALAVRSNALDGTQLRFANTNTNSQNPLRIAEAEEQGIVPTKPINSKKSVVFANTSSGSSKALALNPSNSIWQRLRLPNSSSHLQLNQTPVPQRDTSRIIEMDDGTGATMQITRHELRALAARMRESENSRGRSRTAARPGKSWRDYLGGVRVKRRGGGGEGVRRDVRGDTLD